MILRAALLMPFPLLYWSHVSERGALALGWRPLPAGEDLWYSILMTCLCYEADLKAIFLCKDAQSRPDSQPDIPLCCMYFTSPTSPVPSQLCHWAIS